MSNACQEPKPPKQSAGLSSTPKLLDRVRQVMRLKHYSYRTEQAYVDWIRRFILFHHKRHPQEMGTRVRRCRGEFSLAPLQPGSFPLHIRCRTLALG
jgi:hypothetical protein